MTEQTLFTEALERTDPQERAAFLDHACQGDPALRQRIERLLAQHQHAGVFLEGPPVAPVLTVDEPLSERHGTKIGPYKLVEEIGEGGMGTVWMAQQTEPVKRVVALKLIKAGMDSRQVIARFEAERQALALMDHPNIARVLDGGSTDAGRPYFVMDLVKGVPITRYCDEHRLTPRQRLELFVPICHAVQHAHQKGIIHRDLKPSNVLIALYDDRPVPMVIDFGVAKATGVQLTEATLHTGFGAVVGTVEYMSPEQAGFNQLDVDTRSDVYSLGVLLYELLAGSPPFTRKELEKAGMLEMLRVIREQEPSKPSTKLSTAEGLPTLAANRGTEPAKLTRLVRGELDWIVMKALEKDRSRRYGTANGFAMDVQRYLADEPVLACPPSAGYRLRKLLRRNKRAVAAVGLIMLALVAGIIGTTTGLLRARAAAAAETIQHQRAEKNLHRSLDAVEKMLIRVGEERLQDVPHMEHVRRELLEDALKLYEQLLADEGQQPTLRLAAGRARRVVGDIYSMLGDLDRGLQHYANAQALFGDDDTAAEENRYQRALLHRNRGKLLDNKGRFAEAKHDYDRATTLLKRLAADHRDTPGYRRDLATNSLALAELLPKLDRPLQEALAPVTQAQSILNELVKEFPGVEDYRYQLSSVHRGATTLAARRFRSDEVQEHGQLALQHLDVLLAKWPRKTAYRLDQAYVQMVLGMNMSRQRRLPEAGEYLKRARDGFERVAADFPEVPDYRYRLAATQHHLATVQRRTGEVEDATAGYRRSLEIVAELIGKHPDVIKYRNDQASTLMWLGNCLMTAGRLVEAEKELAQAQKLYQKLADEYPTVPFYQVQLAAAHSNLGDCVHRQGRSVEAVEHHRRAVPVLARVVEKHPGERIYARDLASTHQLLAAALTVTQPDRAGEAFQQALDGWRKLVAASPGENDYRRGLGSTLAQMGNHAEAAKEADELARRAADRSEACAFAARILALCSSSVAKDNSRPEPERQRLAREYADRAVAYVREAVERGLPDAPLLKYEPDTEALQGREDFQELVRNPAKPALPKP